MDKHRVTIDIVEPQPQHGWQGWAYIRNIPFRLYITAQTIDVDDVSPIEKTCARSCTPVDICNVLLGIYHA